MYKIIGGDGNEYGPVTTETLQQWVREGRANAQTQVRAESSTEWQPLGSLPELAAQFNAPPPVSPGISNQGTAPGILSSADYELDIFGCVGRGWNLLTSNFWPLVGGCAIYLLIIGGISGFAQIPFIGPLFSIASLLITGPLVGGVYIFILRAMRGQRPDVSDVFAGFRDNLGQLILAYLIPVLIAGAAAIPGAIMMAVPIIIMASHEAANAGLIALATAGFVLFLVPLIYFSVCWAFTIPLVADRRLDFWPAMKASRAQVGRHWWTVFGLFIVTGLLNLAGMLACCIGMFVSMPLVFIVMLLAYETLFLTRTAQPGAGA